MSSTASLTPACPNQLPTMGMSPAAPNRKGVTSGVPELATHLRYQVMVVGSTTPIPVEGPGGGPKDGAGQAVHVPVTGMPPTGPNGKPKALYGPFWWSRYQVPVDGRKTPATS